MATRYCEFEPSQHRNKRPGTHVWLDDPEDKHPLAICDVCAETLKKKHPNAIVEPRQ